MAVTRPSLDLLRALTDELILRALMTERQLTRAQLATHTGLSKPTVSDSVRRLVGLGLVHDTGERTSGRGRVGSYFALSDDVGSALVVSVAPEAIVVEVVGADGAVTARVSEVVERPARPAAVAQALGDRAAAVCRDLTAPPRLAVVSAADPVDRATGRLVHLPDSPFLTGDLSAVDVLAPLVDGTVSVDNDVNWAARAERDAGQDDSADVVYLYLGEGLGCAVVGDGEVRLGHSGLVGEIAHVLTVGARGRAVPFTQVFDELGLRRPGSTAIDVEALVARVDDAGARGRRALASLGAAVAGVVAACVAFADPSAVVLGGSWGAHPVVIDAIAREVGLLPRPTPVRAARVTDEPALTGARSAAVELLRSDIVGRANAGGATDVDGSASSAAQGPTR